MQQWRSVGITAVYSQRKWKFSNRNSEVVFKSAGKKVLSFSVSATSSSFLICRLFIVSAINAYMFFNKWMVSLPQQQMTFCDFLNLISKRKLTKMFTTTTHHILSSAFFFLYLRARMAGNILYCRWSNCFCLQSFWSAPRIAISGQSWFSLKSDWLIKQNQKKKKEKTSESLNSLVCLDLKDHIIWELKMWCKTKRQGHFWCRSRLVFTTLQK